MLDGLRQAVWCTLSLAPPSCLSSSASLEPGGLDQAAEDRQYEGRTITATSGKAAGAPAMPLLVTAEAGAQGSACGACARAFPAPAGDGKALRSTAPATAAAAARPLTSREMTFKKAGYSWR